MPVIVFASSKGGSGKTTAATLLATVLAEKGAGVVVIDADPNRNVADWAKLPGAPPSLSVVSDVTDENIVDQIEAASTRAAFVIVDLEGSANLLVGHAVSLADFVVVTTKGSQLDAKQAGRTIKLVRDYERTLRRPIPFAVLLTMTSAAIQPRTQRHIEQTFVARNIPVLQTRMVDREAYRAMFSFGGTLRTLDAKNVSNIEAAIANAHELAGEIVTRLRELQAAVALQRGAEAPRPALRVVEG
jgi:chromosome partitioning protein